MIALDDLPTGPPPGFPGARADDTARFACDAPPREPQGAPRPIADEPKPVVTSRE
ncbi:MAG TPA: hypothetical protein VGF53_09670 [Pseudolabrys sp.]